MEGKKGKRTSRLALGPACSRPAPLPATRQLPRRGGRRPGRSGEAGRCGSAVGTVDAVVVDDIAADDGAAAEEAAGYTLLLLCIPGLAPGAAEAGIVLRSRVAAAAAADGTERPGRVDTESG